MKEYFVFETKNESEQHKEVYAYFGLAVYWAQVLEHQIANMLVVSRIMQGQVVSEDEFDVLFTKKLANTLGQLINEITQTYKLSESDKKELKEVLDLRNFIVHDYFKEKIQLFVTTKGRELMINYFIEFRDKCSKIDKRLVDLASLYYQRLGITKEWINEQVEQIKKEAREKY